MSASDADWSVTTVSTATSNKSNCFNVFYKVTAVHWCTPSTWDMKQPLSSITVHAAAETPKQTGGKWVTIRGLDSVCVWSCVAGWTGIMVQLVGPRLRHDVYVCAWELGDYSNLEKRIPRLPPDHCECVLVWVWLFITATATFTRHQPLTYPYMLQWFHSPRPSG